MSRIRLERVGFTYPSAPNPVLREVELDLGSGWTAIAGPNGAGKTTLLRLLAGELRPTEGRRALEPRDGVVTLVHQTVAAPTDAVRRLAEAWDGEARRLRARWQLEPAALDRWPTLSPGERQRWRLAAALITRPHVLLLDEPTNHLDGEARDALLQMAAEHVGVGVIVAHDRALLDALADRVVWVEGGTATLYPGTYSEVRERMRGDAEARVAHRAQARRELSRLDRELDARRRRVESAERSRSTRSRMKSAQDSDAREAGRKGRAAKAARQHAKAQQRMDRRVVEQRDRLDRATAPSELGGALGFDWVPAPMSTLLRVELPAVTLGERILSERTVRFGRDDRVRLAGPNGAGKTTLLRALLSRWPHDPERLLFLPQELDEAARRDAVAQLHALDPRTRGRALTLVAALGVDPKRVLRTPDPSPGEARKVLLAGGLARQVWCIALDEPTNHLDVPSIERLEDALAAYPGALLLVTHDEQLAARVTRDVWTIGTRGRNADKRSA